MNFLLQNYNDGRKKNFYCISVNLLELSELRGIISYVKTNADFAGMTTHKEQISQITGMIQKIADDKGIILKLNKKV